MTWSTFSIDISLTEEGEKHINDIIYMIFQYIELIKQKGILQWIWEENFHMSGTEFKYKSILSSSSYAIHLATKLQKTPYEHVLDNNVIPFNYDEKVIKESIKYFNSDNISVLLTTQEYDVIGLKEEDFVEEPLYHGKYNVKPIDNELLKKCNNPELNPNFHLPEPNKYLPENFTLYNELNTTVYDPPELV